MTTGAVSRSGRWRALYALRVIHPLPTVANALSVGMFALIARHGRPPIGSLLVLLATIFLIQGSIGAANDAFDVDLDRLSKPYKPIVAGAISRRAAVVVAVISAIAACAIASSFGLAAWLLAMTGLACGITYDAGLKSTRFSVLAYVLAMPLLPLWVWVALDRFSLGLLWVYPFGILIGISLYLGNTAPDIASDTAAGIAGTAHRIGLARTLICAWGCLGLTLGLGPILAGVAGLNTGLVAATSAGASLWLVAAVLVSVRNTDPARLRISWVLTIASSLIFALGWLTAAS